MPPKPDKSASPEEIEELVQRILDAGYTRAQAQEALRRMEGPGFIVPGIPAWAINAFLFGKGN